MTDIEINGAPFHRRASAYQAQAAALSAVAREFCDWGDDATCVRLLQVEAAHAARRGRELQRQILIASIIAEASVAAVFPRLQED